MPLSMAREVFITCAVTGAGDTVGRSDKVPITPASIAAAAVEAAKAGAAIAHIHVRDPATGKGARDPKLYREVVERIRASGTDVVINLTAGMGGDLTLGSVEAPLPPQRIARFIEPARDDGRALAPPKVSSESLSDSLRPHALFPGTSNKRTPCSRGSWAA